MKKKFSKNWKTSSQPRKKRKYVANAPLHIRRKFVSVNLSKDLRKKLEKRNLPIKKNDKVKIKRGKFKGKEGKILEVNLKKSKVIIEGIQVKKMDGSKANVKMQPSNLQIIELAERKNKKESKKKNESESKK
jgi:large subunit ribosomal protein L24